MKKPKSAAERKARYSALLAILDELYPNVTCALDHRNAWELLVATILSAQCTDERVNKVTPGLFAKYPTITDLAHAPVAEVAEAVHSTGFFNNKARNIIGAAQRILNEFGGEVPQNIDDLLTVPGAARKTANVVLGTCFGIASGVVVDTHVSRITQRLDFTRQTTPEKIEKDLVKLLPQSRWIQFSHQLIHFGRQTCVARKPRCGECRMAELCYAKDKTAT
jgi:endonuclease-3